jgi:membrane protease YdiL (CAAX protease family)
VGPGLCVDGSVSIVFGLVVEMRLPASHSHEPVSSRAGLILALYGGMGLVALLISAGRGDPDIYRLEGVSTAPRLLASPFLGAVVGLGVVVLSRLAVRRFGWARSLHNDFRHLLGPLTLREIVVLALASSVGEELLFRGALLPIVGPWPQAIIFALLHLGPGVRYLPWTASAFVLALLFGALGRATGDLGGPIVAHFVINFLNLGYITRVELSLPDVDRGAPAPGATPR